MLDFSVSLDEIEFVGEDLKRPECVLSTAGGNLYTADWRGGVALIKPDGTQSLFLPKKDSGPALKPNGIALARDGSFLLADLGERAGLWRLTRGGDLEPVVLEVDGAALPPSNFPLIDERERIWLTVSTRKEPRALGYRPDADDGFIVLIDQGDSRIVADGLGYTNEIQFDATAEWLYVNETFGRKLSRFRVAADGSLSGYEVVARFGEGTFPDGMAFDGEGGIWVVSIVSNRVIRVAPDGSQRIVIEDSDPDHLAEVEEAFQAGTMDRPHLDRIRSRKLRNISSIAFGGPDLKTAYLGCLLGNSVARFRVPVAGRPLIHWKFEE